MKLCSGVVGVVECESYCSALSAVLHHGLEALGHASSPSPCSYDRLLGKLKLAVYLPVCICLCVCALHIGCVCVAHYVVCACVFQLMKALTVTCLRVSYMLKAALIGLTYHVTLLQLLVRKHCQYVQPCHIWSFRCRPVHRVRRC